MQCRPALTFVVGAIFGATVVLVTDDKRMSRIRPLRRAADVGPPPKMDQNLNVSSAAADTTVSPSGDWAKCNTLAVCPVSSQSFVIDG